jgi:peptidoglycan/LPS O-acetylase OafA/YrhL
VFLTLAVVWRRKAARHKRLVLLAAICLLGAPIARITSMLADSAPPMLDIIVYAVLVGLMLAWDVGSRRRPRPETLVGGAAIVGLNAVAVPFGGTALWLAVAHPLMALVPPP